MTVQFSDITRLAAADRAISAEEILELRRAGWANGTITQEEAESIFAAQRSIDAPTGEWSDFFVEAVKQYVLNGTDPRGYASDTEAAWLIAEIERDGRICSMTELELLVSIVETASNVPETLKTFILTAIEQAVLTGTGPTRDGGELSDSHVTSAECRILRRCIFAPASDRPAAVSKREAEMLFRLKDASLAAANANEFERLFVQGVGNYLMGYAAPNAQLSRERVLELEQFVADNKANLGGFLGRMAKDAPSAFGVIFGKKNAAPDRAENVADEAQVTKVEQDWLNSQIKANGQIDAYDQALLNFMAEEVGKG